MNNLFSKSLLRTPIYSLQYYKNISDLDKKSLFEYLKKDEFFLYALYTSSPILYESFTIIQDFDEKLHSKILLSCYKYYTRMCTRCIPFGLFSGVNIINHEKTAGNSHLIRNNSIKTHTRLDSNYYHVLHESFSTFEKSEIRYYTNTSLYKLGKVFRYTEYESEKSSGKRKYILSQIESDAILNKIIKFCKKGAYYVDIVRLVADEGYEMEDSREYIDLLIESQIIVNNFSVSTIGETSEKFLLNEYKKNENSNEFKFLKCVNDMLSEIDHTDFQTSFSKTKELENLLLSRTTSKSDGLYFHKEVYFDSAEFNFEDSKLIRNAVEHAQLLGQKINPSNTRIAKFIETYSKRYGDTVRKLTDVVDIESGIGYGNFLNSGGIDDSSILSGLKNTTMPNSSIELTDIDLFLISKIKNNIDSKSIDIEEKELQHFKEKNKNRNFEGATFSFMANIYENDEEKKYIYLNNIGGNATRLVGRFTNGNHDIKGLAHEIAAYEENYYSDYTCVELDYIPESSLGNVIHREQFRNYKMSFLAGTQQDISIDDLLIQISNNKVVLLTEKGEKILPFFSNAFNVSHPKNLPLFELLVDVLSQFEITNANFFDIKHYHTFFNHIPRITINNTILYRESWAIVIDNLDISKETVFTEKLATEIKAYLSKRNIPVHFVLADGDNELVINYKNAISLEIFFNELKKKKSMIIYEWLPNELNSVVKSQDGSSTYNNEFLFLKKNTINPLLMPITDIRKSKAYKVKSHLTPYSDWVYFKIDIGNKTVDNFLFGLYILVKKLLADKVIEKFFYIKYVEGSFQLRIRFLLKNKLNYIHLLNTVVPYIEKYINDKQVIKFSIETYEREVLRYYGKKVTNFETIFYHDSILSIEMIKKGKGNETPVWIYCLEYIYLLLTNVLSETELILKYVEMLKNSFDKEFNADKFTTKSINLKYDNYIKKIQDIVIHERFSFNVKDKNFINILEEIKEISKDDEDKIFINLSNIIHMHIIRVVQNENRLYEYLIYSFLFKALKTKKYISLTHNN